MANSTTKQKHLKLYTEQPPKPARPPIEAVVCLPRLLRTFQTATGWTLRYSPMKAEGGGRKAEYKVGSGQWKVGSELTTATPTSEISDPTSAFRPPPSTLSSPLIPRPAAEGLAASIADVLGELFETRHALGQREAELAARVPMVLRREEEKHLAERLQAALLAGGEAVGCDAAAIYLLNEATSELKLRSSWGLPFDRLTAPARPLQGAVADLEALLGHAVVLNDDNLMATWNAPEDFPAAVCVPVSSPTTLLGTLWVFSNEKRDFNDRETNIIEVVAGRVASDLEREMLLRAAVDGAELQKQVAAAERLQRGGLPTIAPMLDGWDMAGWTAQADQVGGAFHDWFCLPNGLLAAAVGRAAEQGIAGALTANTVKTALRSHAPYHRQPERVLPQVNLTLWTGSAGDQRAALLLALLETAKGRVSCSSAGRPSAMLLRADGWQPLGQSSTMLGESPEAKFKRFSCQLQPGETLAIFTDGIRDAIDAQGRAFGEAGVANALQGKLDLSAAELVAAVQAAFDAHAPAKAHDRSIVVIKRTS